MDNNITEHSLLFFATKDMSKNVKDVSIVSVGCSEDLSSSAGNIFQVNTFSSSSGKYFCLYTNWDINNKIFRRS